MKKLLIVIFSISIGMNLQVIYNLLWDKSPESAAIDLGISIIGLSLVISKKDMKEESK